MKIRFTFFHGIMVAIIAPIILLTIFIIFSKYNTFGLVEKDYYQKELDYQSQIDRESRTNQLSQNVNIYADDIVIVLQFPSIFLSENISGNIYFFRPSDINMDINIQINLNDDGSQIIDKTLLQHGTWVVKINWKNNEIEYYTEKRIFINN